MGGFNKDRMFTLFNFMLTPCASHEGARAASWPGQQARARLCYDLAGSMLTGSAPDEACGFDALSLLSLFLSFYIYYI